MPCHPDRVRRNYRLIIIQSITVVNGNVMRVTDSIGRRWDERPLPELSTEDSWYRVFAQGRELFASGADCEAWLAQYFQTAPPEPRLVRPPRSFAPPETIAAIARNEVEQLPWRRPSQNAAEQLNRRSAVPDAGFTANVIEGECFDDTRDPALGTV